MECTNSSAPEASVSFNDSYASIIGDVITEEMVKEEKLLEKKAIEEENYLKEQMKEKAEEDNCYKRLNLLLSRSSIYAQFMADKIKRDEVKETKKQVRAEKQKENVGKKRKKVSEYSPSKKFSSVSIANALKNANTESVKQNDQCEVKHLTNISQSRINSQPALLTGAVMHPYQIEGFEWLKTLYENGVNGILADEMGLGKTIQTIAIIAHLIEMGVTGPFFVCGPLSTVPNWATEFKRFTPSIPTVIYHGKKDVRKELRSKIMKKGKGDVSCYPVVITSYTLALMDASLLSRYGWTLLVIDEAHRIKNFQCKLVNSLKTFNTTHRILLTGTPLQNDLAELWSLLNFILPEIFDDLKVFHSWFDISRLTQKGGTDEIVAKEQERQIVSIIHQILTPFLLRRTKAEVALRLPGKKEIIVHAPLTKLQEEYYTAVLNKSIESTLRNGRGEYFNVPPVDVEAERPKRNKNQDFNKIYQQLNDEFLDSSDCTEELNEEIPKVEAKCISADSKDIFDSIINLNTRNISMCLRKICNHPYLVSYPCDQYGEPKIDEDLIASSGKLLVLDAMLSELKKRGHKILLFSQFVIMINIFQDYCDYRNYKYNILHGSMDLEDRQCEIDEFSKSEDSFIFLISTKAGGLGLNLAAADTVIIYDSDWNPQGDIQAQDRCHRIGQNKPVVVYRLIVPNTVDEYILNRATAKRKLEKVIIKKGRFNSRNASSESEKLSIQELLDLLKASDHNGFVKTNDNCVLSPDELNKILDRSDMKECT